MSLVCVPLDVEDTLNCYRQALERRPHCLQVFQHSRSLLLLLLGYTQPCEFSADWVDIHIHRDGQYKQYRDYMNLLYSINLTIPCWPMEPLLCSMKKKLFGRLFRKLESCLTLFFDSLHLLLFIVGTGICVKLYEVKLKSWQKNKYSSKVQIPENSTYVL